MDFVPHRFCSSVLKYCSADVAHNLKNFTSWKKAAKRSDKSPGLTLTILLQGETLKYRFYRRRQTVVVEDGEMVRIQFVELVSEDRIVREVPDDGESPYDEADALKLSKLIVDGLQLGESNLIIKNKAPVNDKFNELLEFFSKIGFCKLTITYYYDSPELEAFLIAYINRFDQIRRFVLMGAWPGEIENKLEAYVDTHIVEECRFPSIRMSSSVQITTWRD